MASILPHSVLLRGGAEEPIRTKLLNDGNIDSVIGMPANLFYSAAIPVCILVLKKCKKPVFRLFLTFSKLHPSYLHVPQTLSTFCDPFARLLRTFHTHEQRQHTRRKTESSRGC